MKWEIDIDGKFLPNKVVSKINDRVSVSLNGIVTSGSEFVVNDRPGYRIQRSGRITECVLNSASFISKNFQSNLGSIPGCHGETKIDSQAIDGLIKLNYTGTGFKIKDKDKLLEVVHKYIDMNRLPSSMVYTLFPMFYGMYVDRDVYDIAALNEPLKDYFESREVNESLRIGVEFETGNIASSFRAINKLFVLFQSKQIDAGVLVTCLDKGSCATRIWPQTNRNGSIQELRQRNYHLQVSLPLVSFGFAPDRFDSDADFLGANGELYRLRDSGELSNDGMYKRLIGSQGEEIYVPRV